MGKSKKNCFITCSGKKDGVGAQAHAVLSTILFAEKFNLQYVHTPFKKISHNNGDNNWEKKWENFFNLGKGEITINEITDTLLNIIYIKKPADVCMNSNMLNVIRNCHEFADINPDFYSNMSDNFIEKYMNSPKNIYSSLYEPGKINIAVHIRRGGVTRKSHSGKRYTDNLYYKYLLHNIISVLDEFKVGVSIQLYSQGLVEEFKELNGLDINYQLDVCPFATFFNLTSADILIMSKSSFSYSAALLSKSIKIYEPFWHKPLSDWIVTCWNDEKKQVEFNDILLKQKIYNHLNSI